ncbi:hypothetical protein [Piscinibacter koreensis]|uniref:Uncharacterized protein n=1 Tax=Piscinibacter koreensis TaxID=2742824 RepID=A0A7Y6TUY8_9BURK|nr:hypothetical protein [Schlegelella koreensis]NUZ04371.1 hypothetical protein [Schlegelella koreensis]
MNQDPTRTPAATSPSSAEPTTLSPTQAPGHYGAGYGENAQHLGDDAALPSGSSGADAGRSTLSGGNDSHASVGVERAGTSAPGTIAGSTQGGNAAAGQTPGSSTVGGATVAASTPGGAGLDGAATGRSGSIGTAGATDNSGNMDPDEVQARPPTRNDAPATPGSDDVSLTFERS